MKNRKGSQPMRPTVQFPDGYFNDFCKEVDRYNGQKNSKNEAEQELNEKSEMSKVERHSLSLLRDFSKDHLGNITNGMLFLARKSKGEQVFIGFAPMLYGEERECKTSGDCKSFARAQMLASIDQIDADIFCLIFLGEIGTPGVVKREDALIMYLESSRGFWVSADTKCNDLKAALSKEPLLSYSKDPEPWRFSHLLKCNRIEREFMEMRATH